VARFVTVLRHAFDEHARDCGDRVVAVALHPDDHDAMAVAEVWGLPVMAFEDVAAGSFTLLCDATGVVIPQVETVDDLLERWTFQLDRTLPGDQSAAA
jgi:hypothetical protein